MFEFPQLPGNLPPRVTALVLVIAALAYSGSAFGDTVIQYVLGALVVVLALLAVAAIYGSSDDPPSPDAE